MSLRFRVCAVLTAILLAVLVGCGGKSTPKTAATPALSGITMTNVSGGNLTIGASRQLTATGTYSDGTTQNLTSSLTWSSSNTAVAKVNSSGLVTAMSAGSATITGVLGNTVVTINITINPTLTSLAISPSNPSITLGSNVQLSATATYSDLSTKDVSSQVVWSSSNSSVATVGPTGQITVAGAGDCTITATIGSVTVSISIHIPAAKTLTSIEVVNPTATPAIGASIQLSATGTYSDSSTADLTSQATWTSSNQTIATVDANGVATTVSAGSVDIFASLNGVSGSVTLVVQPSLVSIDVLPANPAIELNTTQQFSASGNYSDSSQQDLSSIVEWNSNDPAIATIGIKCLASAVTSGSTAITATLGGISGSTILTVHPPHLTSIVVNQDGTTVALGLAQQLSATGTFSDSSTVPLTGVSFTSSDPTIVSIDQNGLATTKAVGNVTITATVGSVSGTGTLTVSPATLVSIAANPSEQAIPLGLTQQFTVAGTFTDSSVQPITTNVTWLSSDPTIASVDQNGLATSLAIGSVTITASVGQLSSSGTLTVTAAQLSSVAITPSGASVPTGGTKQFTATGTYTDSTTQDLSSTATWVSSDGTLATIDNTGLATGVAAGTVTITATSGAVTGTTTLQVTAATLTGLTISPLNQIAIKGSTVQYSATSHFSDGSTVNSTKQVTWSSSVPATVSINNQGSATAHKTGVVVISASLGNTTVSTGLLVITPIP